ncbi:hypothetical protein CDAR_22071 [Caerostris darwini]|uniref:Uncharacterized protein n=1 Tax=Caerostris darwini TaxID=1538125 RepID=A0AAV4VZ90_9ARAC|nr:hypothetical protein CDAR_22071 [Caerostris darwini]
MFWPLHPLEIPSHSSKTVCETSPPFQCYKFRAGVHMTLNLYLWTFIHLSDSLYVEELQKILDEVGNVLVEKMAVKNILSAKVPTVKSSHYNDFFDPESVLSFHNRTKTDFGVLFKNCSAHLCSRRTTSWFVALFYTLVDMSSITKYISQPCYIPLPNYLL